jgi:hypothetical protein
MSIFKECDCVTYWDLKKYSYLNDDVWLHVYVLFIFLIRLHVYVWNNFIYWCMQNIFKIYVDVFSMEF